MRKLQTLLILQILLLFGCNTDRKKDVVANNEHVFDQVHDIQDLRIAMPDSITIKEWATDGSKVLISTNNSDCMLALISLDTMAVSETFGKKGKGAGELLMPHVLGSESDGLMIVDNGNNKIFKLNGSTISEVNTTGESDIFNQPHFIGEGFIGYEELSPSQLALKKYSIADGTTTTILTFPEDVDTDNSDLFDFVWDAYGGNLVTAHLYTDEFSIRKHEEDDVSSSVHYVKGDNTYSQDRIVYSDVACGDYIYLLYQGNVDIENFSDFSTIEKYDYEGNPVSKYIYDGIIDKILLDQEHNRMFFTSAADEDIHYFDL